VEIGEQDIRRGRGGEDLPSRQFLKVGTNELGAIDSAAYQ